MYEPVLDAGAELLNIVVYTIGTLALSGLGLAAEYNSVQQFLHGQQLLAAWFAVMGLVALGFAWNLGREKLLPEFTDQTGS